MDTYDKRGFSSEANPDKAYHSFVNNRNLLSDDIRLSIDSNNNIIVSK